MSDKSTSLAERWTKILAAGNGLYNLVEVDHPLRLYIGANDSGLPTLSVVLGGRPPAVTRFVGLEIETRVRDDSTWLLMFELQLLDAFPEFVAMCGELIAGSRSAESEEAGLRELLDGVDKWRTLFRPLREGELPEDRLRGLAAELACMLDLRNFGRSWTEIVMGWKGPYGAPQDFQLPDGVLLEVKSVHTTSRSVRISSLEQLDGVGTRLLLGTVVVDRAAPGAKDATTLPLLRKSVEDQFRGDYDLLDEFRGRLGEVGYSDLAEYDNYWIQLGKPLYFDVNNEFPVIVRATVPNDVLRVEYDLALLVLSRFRVESLERFFER